MNSNAITLVSFFFCLFVVVYLFYHLSFLTFFYFFFAWKRRDSREKGERIKGKKIVIREKKRGTNFCQILANWWKQLGQTKTSTSNNRKFIVGVRAPFMSSGPQLTRSQKKSLVLALAVFNFTLSSLQEPKSKKDRRGEQLELIRKGDTLWIRRLKINFFSFFFKFHFVCFFFHFAFFPFRIFSYLCNRVYMSLERLWVGESMMTSCVGLEGAGRLWRANSLLIKALSSFPLWIGLALRPLLDGGGKLRASRNVCSAGSNSLAASKGNVEAWEGGPSRQTRGRGPIRWRGCVPPDEGTALPLRKAISSSRRMWRRRFLAHASTSLVLRWYPACIPRSQLRRNASVDSISDKTIIIRRGFSSVRPIEVQLCRGKWLAYRLVEYWRTYKWKLAKSVLQWLAQNLFWILETCKDSARGIFFIIKILWIFMNSLHMSFNSWKELGLDWPGSLECSSPGRFLGSLRFLMHLLHSHSRINQVLKKKKRV